MLARVFEEMGLTTTAVVLNKEHAAKVKPPRALFVPFPYGYALGKPNDPDFQHRVLAAAFELLRYPEAPVLAEFPEDGDAPINLLQASTIKRSVSLAYKGAANEVTALRAFYERWVGDHDGRTLVGLSCIPQRRFRALVRFLESYERGEDADSEYRPADMEVPQFVRVCVDDLKAFYYEARMAQHPESTEADKDDLHDWFWGETWAGKLIVGITERMNATGDRDLIRTAHGLSR